MPANAQGAADIRDDGPELDQRRAQSALGKLTESGDEHAQTRVPDRPLAVLTRTHMRQLNRHGCGWPPNAESSTAKDSNKSLRRRRKHINSHPLAVATFVM